MAYCRICGKQDCKEHVFQFQARKIDSFSGSSPPEIFIGKYNYPNVNIGVLSPEEKGDTSFLSSQELWHEKKLTISEILDLRKKLIFGKTKSNVKKVLEKTKFTSAMQEIAMSSKSLAAEFKLNKPIEKNKENDSHIPLISNTAYVKSITLEENPKIDRKVDYLVNDIDSKSQNSIIELEKNNISTSTIIKILSAGLLGLKSNRKLIPTRWSITAVDDILSKNKLKKIKLNQEISSIQLFNAYYLGNHYEFLLLPDKFSFEVIEINSFFPDISWHDYESFFPRKNYAINVTGAYYANRLALCEYLEKIQRQASCLVIREINPNIYTQSMGVGILRQLSREAFSKAPETFSTLNEALTRIQSRLNIHISIFTSKSKIIQDYGKQKRLDSWFRY
jgi:hypothetical protein